MQYRTKYSSPILSTTDTAS